MNSDCIIPRTRKNNHNGLKQPPKAREGKMERRKETRVNCEKRKPRQKKTIHKLLAELVITLLNTGKYSLVLPEKITRESKTSDIFSGKKGYNSFMKDFLSELELWPMSLPDFGKLKKVHDLVALAWGELKKMSEEKKHQLLDTLNTLMEEITRGEISKGDGEEEIPEKITQEVAAC